MPRISKWLLGFLFVVTPAFAQQQPSPDLTLVINALQAQRNRAMDEAAGAEAQATKVQKENGELRKQLDAMKAKYEPPKKEKKEEPGKNDAESQSH